MRNTSAILHRGSYRDHLVVTVAAGDAGDTTTILETLPQAGEHIAEVACATNYAEVGDAAAAGQRHAPRSAGALGGRSADFVAVLDSGSGSHRTGKRIDAHALAYARTHTIRAD